MRDRYADVKAAPAVTQKGGESHNEKLFPCVAFSKQSALS